MINSYSVVLTLMLVYMLDKIQEPLAPDILGKPVLLYGTPMNKFTSVCAVHKKESAF